MLTTNAAATVPAGTAIDNTALITFQEGVVEHTFSTNTVRLVTLQRRTPSTLELLKVARGAEGFEALTVAPSDFS
ncbi:MAG: hypothetical protein IH614_20600, partial [Desulfuromonadales bacterium]|nr:hypothetical protein [Desulfuromonadales bacterium]